MRKFLSDHSRSEILLNFIFISTVIFLVVIAGFTFTQHQSLIKSKDSVINFHQFNYDLQRLILQVSDLESTERAYLASGQDDFLEGYQSKMDSIYATLQNIRHFTKSQNISLTHIDTLQRLAYLRMAHLDSVIKKYDQGSSFYQLQSELSHGDSLMQDVKGLAAMIGYSVIRGFQGHKNRLERKFQLTPLFTAASFIFSLALVTAAYFKIGSDFRKQQKSLFRLKLNREIFEKAEVLAEAGNWTFDPQTRKINFSNNQYRLLGIKEGEDPEFSLLLKQVVKPDRIKLIRAIRKLEKNEPPKEIEIRLHTVQGEEKCLRMVMKMFTGEAGVKMVIGVNKDLTEIIDSREQLERLNKELSIQNNTYSNAEIIGQMGSMALDCNSLSLTVSENMFRLLRVKDRSTLGSLNDLKKIVHPDDLKGLDGYFDCSVDEVEMNDERQYRLQRANGTYFYVSSRRKLLDGKWGNILTLVVRDITHDRDIAMKLEKQNTELIKSNEQLASFNHIASHDLQEPLRKIQLFCSRIDHEKMMLPRQILTYFTGIQRSAKQMRLLITDLLAFSRVTHVEGEKVMTNLKDMVESALQELSIAVDEKNAQITCENLPSATVVPFQMVQLFTNLIGNSLKYSHPDRIPEITISQAAVEREDWENINLDKKSDLIKIVIRDNGIGFDEAHAKSIFELFQRLHSREKYSGTGIGLAICKKIVQNHQGELYATGVAGKGATFTILLPK